MAGLVGWLLSTRLAGLPPRTAVSSRSTATLACLPDGRLLPGTIEVPFSEHVLLILQWVHSCHGGCGSPRAPQEGKLHCASTFSRLSLQCKASHMAKPSFKRQEISSISWWEELTESHCQGKRTQREKLELFLRSIHREWLINLLCGSSPRANTGFFPLIWLKTISHFHLTYTSPQSHVGQPSKFGILLLLSFYFRNVKLEAQQDRLLFRGWMLVSDSSP